MLLLPGPAPAASAGGITAVAAGFDGRARMGAWTPVWVDVEAPTAGLEGVLALEATSPVGGVAARYAVPVRAGPGARVRVFLPAVFYDARAPGALTLEAAGGRLARLELGRLRPVDEIVLALSRAPLAGGRLAPGVERLELVYLSPERLPPAWQAYEAVRLVIVRDLDERRVDEEQRRALRDWVLAGGRLLAMPSGDDVRGLQGPTLRPLLPAALSVARGGDLLMTPEAGARADGPRGARIVRAARGRGRVVLWEWDGSRPVRADIEARAWEEVLQAGPAPIPPDLESTLPPQRPLPLRMQVGTAVVVLAYIAAVRRVSRLAARGQMAGLAVVLLIALAATAGAVTLAARVRRDASGPVASVVVEALPGTAVGRVLVVARTVAAPGVTYAFRVGAGMLIRPAVPSPVTVVVGADGAEVSGTGSVRLVATALAPVRVRAALDAARTRLAVETADGVRVDRGWLYVAGRVHAVPAVAGRVQVALADSRWLSRDRLARTEPNHALLLWAFSLLESDAILKAHPAWLLGWTRDPALGFRWNGRVEALWQLVLVPVATAE
ncbi:MAG: hypothetical protein QN183_07060 [Armatimonadota bacterium]|nr:hypothetical protein [Armatimonadota bacterium]MDR7532900.1 hypothetical protein [Armatimonadota bacterium]MDR7536107.1 hypothetical protein [Armatimonadota bacterium]